MACSLACSDRCPCCLSQMFGSPEGERRRRGPQIKYLRINKPFLAHCTVPRDSLMPKTSWAVALEILDRPESHFKGKRKECMTGCLHPPPREASQEGSEHRGGWRAAPREGGGATEVVLLYVQLCLPSPRPTSCALQTTCRLWSHTEFKSWFPSPSWLCDLRHNARVLSASVSSPANCR